MNKEKKSFSINKIIITLLVVLFLYISFMFFSVDKLGSLQVVTLVTMSFLMILLSSWLTTLIKEIKSNNLSWFLTFLFGLCAGPAAVFFAIFIVDYLWRGPIVTIRNYGCQSGMAGLAIISLLILLAFFISLVSITINIQKKIKKE